MRDREPQLTSGRRYAGQTRWRTLRPKIIHRQEIPRDEPPEVEASKFSEFGALLGKKPRRAQHVGALQAIWCLPSSFPKRLSCWSLAPAMHGARPSALQSNSFRRTVLSAQSVDQKIGALKLKSAVGQIPRARPGARSLLENALTSLATALPDETRPGVLAKGGGPLLQCGR